MPLSKYIFFSTSFTVSIFLAACGEPPSIEVATSPKAATFLSIADMEAHLTAGKKLVVSFDLCEFSDQDWIGSDDPLGGIKCGEDYTLSYDTPTSTWVAQGLNERSSAKENKRVVDIISRVGPPPKGGTLVLWGAAFTVTTDMKVTSISGGVVGSVRKE